MILAAQGVDKFFGARQVLRQIELKIEDRDRIGLVGVNGAGKSTLLSILSGELEPDAGELSVRAGARIGYLRQNSGLRAENTILQEMESVFAELLALRAQLETLQERMADPEAPDAQAVLAEYEHKSAYFEQQGGYEMGVQIDTILNGMGFLGVDRQTPIATLSGGEKTRLAIARLLLQSPELLILDEPTNHLDFRTLGWLEEYLADYRGAVVVVSHDRYFLDKIVSSIAELEEGALTRTPGGYSQYVRLKRERLERQQKEYELQQQQIAAMEDYVARNLARASTAKSAKSRIAALERMERVEKPRTGQKPVHLRFAVQRQPYKEVLQVEHLRLAVGEDRVLCPDLNFRLLRGEKVAIIGANGVGKSSFIKALLGKIACEEGEILWGHNVSIAYFDQENAQLDPQSTVLDAIWNEYPQMYEQQVRALLGSVLFSDEDVYKRVGDLSGGEKARLALGLLTLRQANLLVLDEPTNHLDFLTKEALDEALAAYEGTLLMVSHDRYLLNRVPTRIVELFESGPLSYEGRYDEYLQKRVEPKPAPRREKAESENKTSYYRTKKQRSDQVRRRNLMKQLEQEIAALEQEIAAVEQELTTPELAADYQLLQQRCADLEALRQTHSDKLEQWLELGE